FRIASQVKPLRDCGKIDLASDPAGHVGYFLWGHLPDPYTLFRSIRSLPAGSSMWVDRNGPRSPRTFCSVAKILSDAESAQDCSHGSISRAGQERVSHSTSSGQAPRRGYKELLRDSLAETVR